MHDDAGVDVFGGGGGGGDGGVTDEVMVMV